MELTKYETIIKWSALLYGICFLFTGFIIFLIFPDFLLEGVNRVSETLFPSLPQYPIGENRFWLSMTVSMMGGVAITSLMIYKDVRKNLNMAIPLCFMKFTSAFCGAGFFLFGFLLPEKNWNSLANGIIFITDFPLGLFMVFLYRKVKEDMRLVNV